MHPNPPRTVKLIGSSTLPIAGVSPGALSWLYRVRRSSRMGMMHSPMPSALWGIETRPELFSTSWPCLVDSTEGGGAKSYVFGFQNRPADDRISQKLSEATRCFQYRSEALRSFQMLPEALTSFQDCSDASTCFQLLPDCFQCPSR